MLKATQVNNLDIFTPAKWQTVILRNYGLVKTNLIAKVLKCTTKRVDIEAARLGIEQIRYKMVWREKSYITIIRNNWNLLNYEQLLTLLDMSEEELTYNLDNNDFLGIKLGNFKPEADFVYYQKLSKEEIKQTHKIQKILKKYFIENYVSPFSFEYNKSNGKNYDKHDRIIYPYSLECGDVFLKTSKAISNEELEAYSSNGINGLWIGAKLRDLCYYPFSKKKDKKYLKRRQNLNEFIDFAKSYGLNVFLYLNEPRGINLNELDPKYDHLKGRIEGEIVALCVAHKEIQNYLYKSTKELVKNIPNLDGIITITSSENLTHCKHVPGSDCKVCKDYRPYELACLINNTMFKAIKDAGSKTRIIANQWGWAPYCDYLPGEAKKGIDLLDQNIEIMCVSEFGTHKKGNHFYDIGEYSLSHAEPCIETIELLNYAKQKNHKILGKIQVNNSWEMSIVPYVPCFENVFNHLKKLRELGVNDYMLSWTLGGFPSAALSLASSCNYDDWLNQNFGNDYEAVKDAIHEVSRGFSYFPFNTKLLYLSPLNQGPSNLLYRNVTNRKATMVTFPYDDVSSWVSKDEENDFINKMQNLIKHFKKALKILMAINNPSNDILEIIRYLNVWTICYESTLNQYLFNLNKVDENKNLNIYLNKELKLTLELYKLASLDSTIGFEASNQYVFTQNTFLEKIINIILLKKNV